MGRTIFFKRAFVRAAYVLAAAVFMLASYSFRPGPADPSSMTFGEIEKYVQKCDQLKVKNQLVKYEHIDMTAWGSLTGYWNKDELVIMEARYNAELGYTARTVYLLNGKICRISVNLHVADWAEYERNHGNEEFDHSKVRYIDDQYDYTFGKELTARKLGNGTMEVIRADHADAGELLAEVKEMKDFLEEASAK